MNKRVLLVSAAILLAGALAAFFAVGTGGGRSDGDGGDKPAKKLIAGRRSGDRNERPSDAVRKAMRGVKRPANAVRKFPADIFSHLSGKDKAFAEAVQKALDDNDFKATLTAATKALTSTNAEVRLDAVQAMGWFGLDALPELTEAMADADEDVANAAEDAWELALSEVDNAERRFAIAAAAMATLSSDDHLMSISGQLACAAQEMIDGEEDEQKADDARVAVVQSLVDIMDSGKDANIEQAKSAYEDITGHEWVSIEEAELYLSDPDNYELPEDRDEVADGEGAVDDSETGEEAQADEAAESEQAADDAVADDAASDDAAADGEAETAEEDGEAAGGTGEKDQPEGDAADGGEGEDAAADEEDE